VAERVREKGLAHPDGPDDGDVVMGFQEAEGGELVEERAVEGDLRRGIPVLELRAGVEARTLRAEGRGQAIAPGHLVGEDEQEKVLVRHLLLARERLRRGSSGSACWTIALVLSGMRTRKTPWKKAQAASHASIAVSVVSRMTG
jgi:hypothetical protein